MPLALTTKNTMPGIKRKSAPEKDVNVKGSKKPKIDNTPKSANKSKSTRAPAKVFEESGDSTDDWDEDDEGGAGLDEDEGEDVDMGDDGDSEPTPNAADGLHPDRAKAVVTNSQSMLRLGKGHINN